MLSSLAGPASHHVVVKVWEASLHRRRWRSRSIARQPMTCLLVVTDGDISVTGDSQSQQLSAPVLLFIPQGKSLTIDIAAGCNCVCIGLSESLLSESIGLEAESAGLWRLAKRYMVNQVPNNRLVHQIETLVSWCDQELRENNSLTWMCIAAYVKLLLVCVQRSASEQDQLVGDETHLPDTLQRFRHLVELHYREHWTIRQYADAMGMTYERLHGLCRRELDNTPLRLVQQRVANEAQARLERSGQSIKEIGALLGFPDSPTFSHFFKRMVGETPGRYRSNCLACTETISEVSQPAFADWP